MRVFLRITAMAVIVAGVAGCTGIPGRRAVLDELDPAPMPARAWASVRGSYEGPVHTSTQRFGFEGYGAMEMQLQLGGSADAPVATLRTWSGISTAWTYYGERKRLYSNNPTKRYGSQGYLYVSSHAPDQVLIQLEKFGSSLSTEAEMILTFRRNGDAYVEWLGHSGWRGDGVLTPISTIDQRE